MPNLLVRSISLVALLSVVSIAPPGWAEEPKAKGTPARAAVILDRPAVVEFEQAKLTQVLDWLRTTHGLKVLVDRAAIAGEGLSTDALVDIKVKHLPLKAALQLTLEPLQLGFLVRDNVLVVTTAARAEASVIPVVYPVGDLLQKGVPGNPEAWDYEALTDLVTDNIAPTSWEDKGGAGSLAAFETSLVVSQSASVHDEIARLLADLRSAKLLRPREKPGPVASGPWTKSISLKFEKTPLPDVLARLSEASGVDILIDRAEIGEHPLLAPLGPGEKANDDDLVSAELENTTLREALREVLFPHTLAHLERHGAVIVTSQKKADEHVRLQIYDVKALLRDRDGVAETVADLDYDAVLMLLMSAVSPNSWDDAGGIGTLCAYDGFLLVWQSDDAHQQIDSLLDQLRQVKFPAQAGGPAPPDADLRKALDSNTVCDFADVKLADVLDALAEKHDIEISLDKPALARASLSADAPVNLRLGELKLQTALQFILEPLDLRYYLHNGVLVVSTPDVVAKHPSPRVYDLADFAAVARKPKLAAFDISQLILKTIEPATWLDAGGHGTVVVFENTLVVSNSHAVHCRIEELLAELCRLRPKATGK